MVFDGEVAKMSYENKVTRQAIKQLGEDLKEVKQLLVLGMSCLAMASDPLKSNESLEGKPKKPYKNPTAPLGKPR